jgi:hypothetical protein
MLLYDSISGLSEEQMMSQRSKCELLVEIQSRYLKAKKAEKQKILDEFTAATGYHRKYAVRLLKHGYPRRKAHCLIKKVTLINIVAIKTALQKPLPQAQAACTPS